MHVIANKYKNMNVRLLKVDRYDKIKILVMYAVIVTLVNPLSFQCLDKTGLSMSRYTKWLFRISKL